MDTHNHPLRDESRLPGIPVVLKRDADKLPRRRHDFPRIAGGIDLFDANGVCIAADVTLRDHRTSGVFRNTLTVPASPSVESRSLDTIPHYSDSPLSESVLRFIAVCDSVIRDNPPPWREQRDKLATVAGISSREATKRIRRMRLVSWGLFVADDSPATIPQPTYRKVRFNRR